MEELYCKLEELDCPLLDTHGVEEDYDLLQTKTVKKDVLNWLARELLENYGCTFESYLPALETQGGYVDVLQLCGINIDHYPDGDVGVCNLLCDVLIANRGLGWSYSIQAHLEMLKQTADAHKTLQAEMPGTCSLLPPDIKKATDRVREMVSMDSALTESRDILKQKVTGEMKPIQLADDGLNARFYQTLNLVSDLCREQVENWTTDAQEHRDLRPEAKLQLGRSIAQTHEKMLLLRSTDESVNLLQKCVERMRAIKIHRAAEILAESRILSQKLKDHISVLEAEMVRRNQMDGDMPYGQRKDILINI
eukprot:Clim_evm163s157 gene=Clim_evmTU163s157